MLFCKQLSRKAHDMNLRITGTLLKIGINIGFTLEVRFCSDRNPYFKLVDRNGDLTFNSGLLLYNNGIVCASQSLNKNAATAICTEMGYNGSIEWETGDKWNVQNSYSIKVSRWEM